MDNTLKFGLSTSILVVDGQVALSEEQRKRKMTDIRAFLGIDRRGLAFLREERQLLMHRTAAGEEIYIQYPGKESTEGWGAQRYKTRNPYDFRPELYLPDGQAVARMSFWDVAETLSVYHRGHGKDEMEALAVLLVRLAFLEGYTYRQAAYRRRTLSYGAGDLPAVGPLTDTETVGRYALTADRDFRSLVEELGTVEMPTRQHIGKHSVSMEGFLYYLDLLAQQEDCKYYYNFWKRGDAVIPVGVGRINNLLTLAHVIHLLIQGKDLGAITSGMKTRVEPLAAHELPYVSGGLVTLYPSRRALTALPLTMPEGVE